MPFPLPQKLIESLRYVKGFNEQSFLNVHQSGEQVTSIRLNEEKIALMPVESCAEQDLFTATISNTVWCPAGRYLSERPSFTLDPLLHGGAYYVQEASSMFLWNMLENTTGKNTNGIRVLDLCAAPGGKTTLLAAYFKDGLIVANEVIKSRASILNENISKWGSDNVIITNNDPKDFSGLEGYFDVIMADAPCSGSGLFRKNNEAIEEWSDVNVMHCNARQQRILADVYPALKKDGFLIYSTCSYSIEENEMICEWIINNYQVSAINLALNPDWGIVESVTKNGAFGYRFYPDKIKGEGFFIAAFQKKEGGYAQHDPSSISSVTNHEMTQINNWVKPDIELFFFKQKENILAVPQQWKQDVALLKENFYLRKAGVNIGVLKGKDFVPHHELALSLLTNKHISRMPVNREEALNFLRKKELNHSFKNYGWVLVSFENINLGWIKVLQNRVNNYYPSEWRIIK